MLNIAHRGFSSKYPENTMLAFRKAMEEGADGIEFDVHLSKDKIPVIIHDERIDRTCNGEGRVQDFTAEELQNFNAGKLFGLEQEGVPTLREYLEYVQEKSLITNIELKTGVYEYPGIEQKVYDLLREFHAVDKVIISSFNHESILRMKKIDPNIPCGLLVDSWLIKPWEYVKGLGVEYYHPAAYGITKEIVEGFHREGIGINVWFGKEPWDFEKMASMGVDAMITDYPDQIKHLL